MRKSSIKAIVLAVILALTALVVPFAACNDGGDSSSSKTEFTYKGETGKGSDEYMGDPCKVYWIDAAAQKPGSYTKIIGFTLTVKFTEAGYYGGWKESQENPMGMLLLTKGAHEASEYVFTYPNEQSPTYDLSTKDIVTFCTGKSATYVVDTAFSNGEQVRASVGDTVELSYKGSTALFTEGDSVMTAVCFLGSYELISVEWELGEPEEVEAIDWDNIKVNTKEYLNIRTVEGADELTDEEYGYLATEEVTVNGVTYSSGDVVPGTKGYGYNYVDITIPDTDQESYPVILWIHGGGYITGNRKSVLLQNNKEYLLSQGYAFVSVEYKLTEAETLDNVTTYGEGGMPEMLQNIKLAVRYLRANASKYKLDTSFIAAMGESAGAGLAMLMATTNGLVDGDDGYYDEYFAEMYGDDVANRISAIKYEDTSTGWANYSSDVQAAVTVCAPSVFSGDVAPYVMSAYIGSEYNDYLTYYSLNKIDSYAYKDYYDALSEVWSPADLVGSNTAPLYLAYSKEDTTVSFDIFGTAIQKAVESGMSSDDYKEVFYEKGGHVDRSVFDSDASCVDIATWVNAQRAKVQASN